jgi:hypothetical protein
MHFRATVAFSGAVYQFLTVSSYSIWLNEFTMKSYFTAFPVMLYKLIHSAGTFTGTGP